LTVDPALHDNALPLDSKSGRPVFLKVIRGGRGSGLVKSLPAGIHCGSDCLEKYGSAAELVLVAEPGPGSRFAGWNGACRGTGTCNLSVDAPTTVRAVFEPADEGHGKVHNPGTHPSRRQGAQP
jgi:hypothetical protein